MEFQFLFIACTCSMAIRSTAPFLFHVCGWLLRPATPTNTNFNFMCKFWCGYRFLLKILRTKRMNICPYEKFRSNPVSLERPGPSERDMEIGKTTIFVLFFLSRRTYSLTGRSVDNKDQLLRTMACRFFS